MARHCTVPKIFGLREWFEGRYKECCKRHDDDYELKFNRKKADVKFLICMLSRSKGVIAPIAAYWFVRLFGWVSYYYSKEES